MSSSAGGASTSPRDASKTSCAPAYPPLLHQNRHQPATLRQPRTAKTGAAQSVCAQVLYHEYPSLVFGLRCTPRHLCARIGSAHPRCLSLDLSPNAVLRAGGNSTASRRSSRAWRLTRARVDVLPRRYQLIKSMDHMHRNGIFHRDIKPETIVR